MAQPPSKTRAFPFNQPLAGVLKQENPAKKPSLRINTNIPVAHRTGLRRPLPSRPANSYPIQPSDNTSQFPQQTNFAGHPNNAFRQPIYHPHPYYPGLYYYLAFVPVMAAVQPPPFENADEWIAMVTHVKNTMSYEVRTYDPKATLVNEMCRLCCSKYSEPFHVRWFLRCCGAPCGRPCLAIAMYHDNSHRCPFCLHVFPQFPEQANSGQANLETPMSTPMDTPIYDLDSKSFENLCRHYESHWTFTQTKVDFSVGELGGEPAYRRKSYRDWRGMVFAPIAKTVVQSKESFSVVDLEKKGRAKKCKISLPVLDSGS